MSNFDPRDLSRAGIEVWKDVPGHEGYQVSNLGNARSLDRTVVHAWRGGTQTKNYKGRVLRTARQSKSGHRGVTFGQSRVLVHQMVLLTFDGARPQGLMTRHLDGDAANNALHNLAYGTASENRHDDVRHGIYDRSKGGKARNVKLTEEDVRQIRARVARKYERGYLAEIAREYGVSWGAIKSVINKINWSHIA